VVPNWRNQVVLNSGNLYGVAGVSKRSFLQVFYEGRGRRFRTDVEEKTASLYTAFCGISSTYASIIRAKIKAARCVLIQVTATP
jgi:hypothetical protein